MRVCGIVAEYDPFHLGHAYHLNSAREQSQADFVVCVMGCAFSQRGTPMLLGPHTRARMAVLAGADVVLGMPFLFPAPRLTGLLWAAWASCMHWAW